MFIQVRLLNGFIRPLWYRVPASWKESDLTGVIVQVPLRNTIIPAIVQHVSPRAPIAAYEIKEAHGIEPFPDDPHYAKFTHQLAQYYQVDPFYFVKRVRSFVQASKIEDSIPLAPAPREQTEVLLTPEQQTVTTFLKARVSDQVYAPTLLHGVTGSGKTEVYKELIIHAIAEQKTVLLLLPEVTLAVAFEHRLREQLPNHIPMLSFHSAVGPKEKRQLWQGLLNKKPMVIIGVHLPILLPIANLGLIIIDEEHEIGYQEKKHPKINSKEAAIMRAQLHQIPILLGSATPSLSTLYNVKQRKWHFFQLKNRFGGAFPKIETVMLTDKKARKNFWISDMLYKAIQDRLLKNEQTIIFLNRRGYSFFVQCKTCSFIFECQTCSVSLTLHNDNQLSCHYCGHLKQLPKSCPSCKGSDAEFLKKGIGTQQVVSILQKLFPQARVERADMDTTTKKKKWQYTVEAFSKGTIDILVGTQTITKGYDFPGVTLVGILWADLNLHFPIFNAAETTLQQLIQVAGRAGRQKKESLVIVQAMDDHTIFSYLNEIDYLSYYQHELNNREEMGYPPCKRLVEIELKHTNEQEIEREAHHLASTLISLQNRLEGEVTILGPAKPPVYKIKNVYSRKIYLKSAAMKDIVTLWHAVDMRPFKSLIFFTPNPLS
jgi:primosomal protein N' (replication factor Y)